jgi:1-acyl-sn-glycerol-3-phosphate acyltransferase
VLVYPGGDFESYRPSWHQSRIEFGGRKGFLRLARKMGVPIVPVVAIGGQETALFFTRGQRLAQATGWDRLTRIKVMPFQVAPPFGLTFLDLPTRVPLPAKIKVQVLEPIDLDDIDGRPAYKHVTGVMQEALSEMAEERSVPILG